MYFAFLNPQGNFDKLDSFWTEHPDFGGQLVYVKEIAIALAELGHEVDIFTRKFSDSRLNCFEQDFDYYDNSKNVRIVRISCGGSNFLKKELLWEHLDEWTNNILEFFKKQNRIPNFVTGHYGDGGLSAALIKSKLKIPYSFTGHSLGAQKLEKLGANLKNIKAIDSKYYFSKRIEAERIAIKYSDIIFVSTEQEKLEQYSHPLYQDITSKIQDRFVVAPPGANTEVFSDKPHELDQQYLSKFNSICQRDIFVDRLDLPYIISASRLDPKKNHLGLVKAYAQNNSLQKKANLAISLRGIENAFKDYSSAKPDELEILNQIMRIIDDYHLAGKVTFISINSQTELAAFYRYMVKNKSLFALTALYEPFGLAPIEAMSTGLPAVVTKYGGPSDVLKEGQVHYGVLVDAFDEEDIAYGLLDALENHEEYQKLGLKRVNEKYTWKATARKYLDSIIKNLKDANLQAEVEINSYFTNKDKSEINLSFIIKNFLEMEN
jgi:sucrose-phosphate synthase